MEGVPSTSIAKLVKMKKSGPLCAQLYKKVSQRESRLNDNENFVYPQK